MSQNHGRSIKHRLDLKASGNLKAARDYYEKLESLTADRDIERPELVHARAFLRKK